MESAPNMAPYLAIGLVGGIAIGAYEASIILWIATRARMQRPTRVSKLTTAVVGLIGLMAGWPLLIACTAMVHSNRRALAAVLLICATTTGIGILRSKVGRALVSQHTCEGPSPK